MKGRVSDRTQVGGLPKLTWAIGCVDTVLGAKEDVDASGLKNAVQLELPSESERIEGA